MTVRFDPRKIVTSFNDDPEFRIQARYWTGELQFGVGDALYSITLKDGVIVDAEVSALVPLTDADEAKGSLRVRVAGSAEGWDKLTEKPTPPFYLDYYGASAHHGFTLGGDPETLWAYYPAIRRTADLFREIAIKEEN